MNLSRSVADVLDQHVGFEVERLDRMYLISDRGGVTQPGSCVGVGLRTQVIAASTRRARSLL